MEQKEFEIKGYKFRIAKMNAIDVLAFRTQLKSETYDETETLFNNILEHIEVCFEGKWFPVKEKNKNNFMPACVEDDLDLVDKLIGYFTKDFLMEVFQKYRESKA